MPPLRFKAVCTETGREFGVYEINRHIISLPSHNAQWFSWDQITIYEDIEDFTSKYNPELCQSTGLTDAMKKEIFFDDVILLLNEKSPNYGHLFIVSFEDCTIVFKRMDGKTCFWASSREHYKPEYVVIGNRWMPQAELKARAEAVRNG